MRRKAPVIATATLLVILPGCVEDTVVSPAQQVVVDPESDDFGLTGSWISVSIPHDPFEDQREAIEVSLGEDGRMIASSGEGAEYAIRATRLGDDLRYSILEFERILSEVDQEPGLASFDGPTDRYLGIGMRKEDRYYLWFITTDRLLRAMREDNHSAVIEKGMFASVIHADSDELLATIRMHSRELVGDPSELKLAAGNQQRKPN